MYINTSTGQYPLSELDLKLLHPNTSFPTPFTPPDGYVWVFPAPRPTHDAITQAVREIAPALTDKGHWEQRWEVYALDPETVAANQAAANAALIASFDAALTQHLDSTAQARRYDNRITCALRAGFVGPFQAEGTAFAQWMDACNLAGYQLLTDVQSGVRPAPTVSEFLAELPPMVWPD